MRNVQMMTGQIVTRWKSPIQSLTINQSMEPWLGNSLIPDRSGYSSTYRDVIWGLTWSPLNIIRSWAGSPPQCALCALWSSARCHYGRLESVTVLHLANAVINSRDMGPIVSGRVTRRDVGYYPATSKLWEHSWHLVTCSTPVTTVSNIGSDMRSHHLVKNRCYPILFSARSYGAEQYEKSQKRNFIFQSSSKSRKSNNDGAIEATFSQKPLSLS